MYNGVLSYKIAEHADKVLRREIPLANKDNIENITEFIDTINITKHETRIIRYHKHLHRRTDKRHDTVDTINNNIKSSLTIKSNDKSNDKTPK